MPKLISFWKTKETSPSGAVPDPSTPTTVPIKRAIKTIHRQMLIIVALIVTVALIGVVALSYKHSSDANHRSYVAAQQAANADREALSIATCVNTLLGIRAQPQTNDQTGLIAWVTALNKVFTASGPEQQAALAALEQATATFLTTLQQDQNFRSANPLGTC